MPVKADMRQKKGLKKTPGNDPFRLNLTSTTYQLLYILRSIQSLKKSLKGCKTGKNFISDLKCGKRAEKWRGGRWEKGLRESWREGRT